MIVFVAVDETGGTMFNHRRQSMDRALRRELLARTQGKPLWMSAYTRRQFREEETAQFCVDEDCLTRAAAGEYCFAEGQPLAEHAAKIEQICLFRWDKRYPKDQSLDLALQAPAWVKVETKEFAGSSHECITLEVYDHVEM